MLSQLIDDAYYGLRYLIWGPEIPWDDGTYTPEGRPPDERFRDDELWEFFPNPDDQEAKSLRGVSTEG